MNAIGEVLDLDKAVCREFDVQNDVHRYIASSGIYRMTWGFTNPLVAKKNLAYRFTVSGMLHKGFVYIVLDFMDTFNIYYTNKQNKIKKISNDVYIDQLIEILDIEIEKIPKYKF